jgi:O-antigen ligase
LGLKGVFIGIVACLFIFLTAYYLSSSFEKRVAMTLEQIQNPAALEEDTHAISNPRVLMWKLVLKTFPEHPLLGYGVRGYWVVANTVPSELDQTAKGLTDPHNQFLFILSELGLIGLTVFLAGLAYLLRFSWQQKDQYNATLMQLSLIIFCIAGLTNVHFNMVYPYQFFIGFLCLAFAVKPVRSLS